MSFKYFGAVKNLQVIGPMQFSVRHSIKIRISKFSDHNSCALHLRHMYLILITYLQEKLVRKTIWIYFSIELFPIPAGAWMVTTEGTLNMCSICLLALTGALQVKMRHQRWPTTHPTRIPSAIVLQQSFSIAQYVSKILLSALLRPGSCHGEPPRALEKLLDRDIGRVVV